MHWIPREQNEKADELSKMGLNQLEQRRFVIRGTHEESNTSWIKYQSNHLNKVEQVYNDLFNQTNSGQQYEIWDNELQQPVLLNK